MDASTFIHIDSVLSSTREGVKVTVKSKCEFTPQGFDHLTKQSPPPQYFFYLVRFRRITPLNFPEAPLAPIFLQIKVERAPKKTQF